MMHRRNIHALLHRGTVNVDTNRQRSTQDVSQVSHEDIAQYIVTTTTTATTTSTTTSTTTTTNTTTKSVEYIPF